MARERTKGLEEFFGYSLFESLLDRRSRRFQMGGEIPSGPLKYKSSHKPVPLTELEEALLLWAGGGMKGLNLSDFPPEKGLDLEVKFVSKTIPSLGDIHRTEIFYTNDNGTYMIKQNDKIMNSLAGIKSLKPERRLDIILQFFDECRIKISDKRAELAKEPPGLAIHNTWNVNKPGSTLMIPVTDLSAGLINILFFYERIGHRYNFLDELKNLRPAGTEKWLKNGFLNKDKSLNLIEAEIRFASAYMAEQPLFCQNVNLAQQALGLGGWLFTGFASRYMLGADPESNGLGFKCIDSDHPDSDWGSTVTAIPVGLDGHFVGFCPPYYANMGEAVDAFNDMKWTNWETDRMPYKESQAVLDATRKPTKKEIMVVKDLCNYIYETYGSFPAFSDTMYTRMMVQSHVIDLDFYDKFYSEGTYSKLHKEHGRNWNKKL